MDKEVIPIASDHPAYDLKQELISYLSELGYRPLDLGTFSKERVDYPIYALSVASKVSMGQYKRGIVICKTGVGVSIVANKFPGIRASLVNDVEVAELTRKHNDTNVLALSAGFTSIENAKKIVKVWLETEPEGGRHQKRIDQISTLEYHLIRGHDKRKASEILSSAMLNATKASDIRISASLMCANQLNMLEDVEKLVSAGIDQFHIDIIDGNFAPNVSLNVEHIEALRKHTHLPIDVHLMVEDPFPYIPRVAKAGADIVILHLESEANISNALDEIKSHGMKAGLALEVDTPLEKAEPFFGKIDLIMFMTVKTGFKGSQFVPDIQKKIREFNELREREGLHISIMVDGSLGPRTLPHLYQSGARIFVGGTSGLFKAGSFKSNLEQMRSFCY